MVGVRRVLADGWAPSASIMLHAVALLAAILFAVRPAPPISGERPIPVSLVAIAAPPPSRAVEPPEDPVPPPVTTTAEAPLAAPPVKKVKPRPRPPRHEPPAPQATETSEAPVSAPPAPSAPPADAGATRSVDAGDPSPSYLASLRQKLERNKTYPRAARQRRQEGTAILRFVIDRDGHVLSRRVEKGTGYGDLDREVEAMLERAQPLPPMPPEMSQARLELVVPIDFHLR